VTFPTGSSSRRTSSTPASIALEVESFGERTAHPAGGDLFLGVLLVGAVGGEDLRASTLEGGAHRRQRFVLDRARQRRERQRRQSRTARHRLDVRGGGVDLRRFLDFEGHGGLRRSAIHGRARTGGKAIVLTKRGR
jgi:hypothetical protein